MFIEVNVVDSCGSTLINLNHVTKIVRTTTKTVLITDIHNNKIVCEYTTELANTIVRLKRLGQFALTTEIKMK